MRAVQIIKWTIHFREDDYKVIYAQLNDQQVGQSQNWRSGKLDRQDVGALEEMLCAAYERGLKDMRDDMRRLLGFR